MIAQLSSDRISSPLGSPPRHAMLVIGYGNDLRSDDGAGIRVATMIAAQSTSASRSRVIITQQLTPDLADDIAAAEQVIFVDAYPAPTAGAELRVEKITADPAGSAPALGHRGDPAGLMRLADRLFGALPEAWLVGIPAYSFAAGESISPATLQMIDEAVALIGERAFSGKSKGERK
jgi:hydrogenase maturation protease